MASSRTNEQEALPSYTQSQTPIAPIQPSTEPLVTIPINYRYQGNYRPGNTTFISVPPTITLQALYNKTFSAIAAEPDFKLYSNFKFLAVKQMAVYWAGGKGQLPDHSERRFPLRTELHEGNLGATLRYVDRGRGYDVVGVELG